MHVCVCYLAVVSVFSYVFLLLSFTKTMWYFELSVKLWFQMEYIKTASMI